MIYDDFSHLSALDLQEAWRRVPNANLKGEVVNVTALMFKFRAE